MKSKSKVTRIGGIATPCNGGSRIVLPRSLGKRVFALLKEDYDKMRRQQARRNTAQIAKFASALVSQGNQRCAKR